MKLNLLITFIFFIVSLIVCLLISEMIINDRILEQKQNATNLAANTAYSIQGQLSTSLSATSALAAFVRHNGKIKDFNSLANEMLKLYNGISSLQLAPNGYVTDIYPIEGNENAKGSLLDDPIRKTEALAAIHSGKLTLAGPYQLKQGGVGVIGRYPVFQGDSIYKKFWGFTIVLIKLNLLLEKSALSNLDKTNFYYKLWRIHPDSGEPYVFATNNTKNIWATPVNFTFLVPNGKWTLSIEPRGTWYDSKIIVLLILFSFLFSVIVSSFLYYFLRQHYITKQSALNLAEINATKDKFFSIIAHDLKSPFFGFLGLTKMMSENINDFNPTELQDISKSMQKSANDLYKLLENLLEWSKMQRGLTEFNPEVCFLSYIIKINIDILSQFARQKDIEIINYISENLTAKADVSMLNTIIRNLISNAIKFTPRGGKIVIGITDKPSDDYIIIHVRDTGIGMSKELIAKLFRIDEKVSRTGTEGESSTGLGLMLCKEFIEKHGCRIWVDSKVGIGSTFNFTLPKH